MKPIAVRSISELAKESRRHYGSSISGVSCLSPVLYRGQANADWPLKTTLERFSTQPFSMSDYTECVRLIGDRFPALCAASPYAYLTPANTWPEFIGNRDLRDAMVCLRHLGFPSPLLDWTASPYIAAYFSFRDARGQGQVAVYAYKETNGIGKSTWTADPNIRSIGHNLRTHSRHHVQQAQYTLCLAESEGIAPFRSHEDVFARGDVDQDLLAKFILPAEIRDDALAELHSMNINEHSLFGSEEGLCRALAQELIPRSPRRQQNVFGN